MSESLSLLPSRIIAEATYKKGTKFPFFGPSENKSLWAHAEISISLSTCHKWSSRVEVSPLKSAKVRVDWCNVLPKDSFD